MRVRLRHVPGDLMRNAILIMVALVALGIVAASYAIDNQGDDYRGP